MKRIDDFNDRVALAVTNGVSTMWCAYLFAVFACITLPDAIAGGFKTFVPWLAQTFIQLVLLSIIMVGQKIQAQQTIDLHTKVDTVHEKLDAVHENLGISK